MESIQLIIAIVAFLTGVALVYPDTNEQGTPVYRVENGKYIEVKR